MSDYTPDGGRYPHVLAAVRNTPWAILPDRFDAIMEMLELRASGVRLTDDEIKARIGAGPSQAPPREATGTVAVLPLYGVIVPRADMFTQISGGTSAEGFIASLQAAANDPAIDSILLDIDSPGGSTAMIPEAAAAIREARDSKPVVAVANTNANSAAYWLGSQADEFVVTPSGSVGSIGVFAAHQDISAKQEKEGVRTTIVKAGKFKADTNPYEPLSEEAAAALQGRVDDLYGMFVADVAEGRGVTTEQVRSGFAEGRVVTASQALEAGMVDRIDTFEATVQRMIGEAQQRNTPGTSHAASFATDQGTSFAGEAERARVHADGLVSRAQALAALRQADGRDISAANRERLTDTSAALKAAASSLDELVTVEDSNANQHADEVLAEVVRFEALRANL